MNEKMSNEGTPFTDEQQALMDKFIELSKAKTELTEQMVQAGIRPAVLHLSQFRPDSDEDCVLLTAHVGAFGSLLDLSEMVDEHIRELDKVIPKYKRNALLDLKAMAEAGERTTIIALLYNAFTCHRLKCSMSQLINALSPSEDESAENME